MLRAGKPAAAVVTEVFVNLARTAARARGFDSMPVLVLPHPMETRSPAEIEHLAHERFDELVALIARARG